MLPQPPDRDEPEPRASTLARGLEPDFLWRALQSGILLGLVFAGVIYGRWGAAPAYGFLAGGGVSLASFGSIIWLAERLFRQRSRRSTRSLVAVLVLKYPLLIAALVAVVLGINAGHLNLFSAAAGLMLAPFALVAQYLGALLQQYVGSERR